VRPRRGNRGGKEGLTRRDFLGSALYSSSSLLLTPPILHGLLCRRAQAEGLTSWEGQYGLIHLHLSGGAGIWSWWAGKDATGALMPLNTLPKHATSTSVLSAPNGLFSGFGAPMYHMLNSTDASSTFTQSLLAQVSEANRPRIALCPVALRSQDDNVAANFSGVVPAANYSGLRGRVADSAGETASASGNNTVAMAINPLASRLNPGSVSEIINAAAWSRTFLNDGQAAHTLLAKGIQDLTVAQGGRLGSSPGAGAIQAMLAANATELVARVVPPSGTAPDDMNPANDAEMRRIFGATNTGIANAANFANSANAADIRVSVIYNVLKGTLGASAMMLGGYDYHGDAGTSTRQRDALAGVLVGQILEAAAALGPTTNRGLVLYITTDGGLAATERTGILTTESYWAGDRGQLSGAAIFVVNGAGLPTQVRTFFGALDPSNGQVDDDLVVGGTDKRGAAVLMANWLALNGKLDRLEAVLSMAGLTRAEIEKIRAEGMMFQL